MKTELNLGTFLSVLCHYKASTTRQTDLVGAVMHSIYLDFDDSDNSCCSNLVRGKKNPKRDIIDSAIYFIEDKYQDFVSIFHDSVLDIIDQNFYRNVQEALITIIEKDVSIAENCVINPITGATKRNLRTSKDQLSEFLAGLFLYILKTTDNRDKTELVRSLNDAFYKKIDKKVYSDAKNIIAESIKEKVKNKIVQKDSLSCDENVYRVAQRFRVRFEDEIGLLPLCQIASFVSPLHNYVRKMYTEYCLCSRAEKEMILSLNNQIIMDFSDENWISRCLKLYDKKIHESGICTCNFLYEGAKYFHRAFERYSKEHIVFDPYIFKPIYTHKGTFDYKKHPVNLTGYVYDYLFLKEENKHKKIEPPLDCVWDMCRDYSEDGVTFWVCMMIISSCYQICDNYLNTRPEDFKKDDVRYISLGDHVSLIDTQEDVYLYALLELYINLYNEK